VKEKKYDRIRELKGKEVRETGTQRKYFID